MNQSMQQKIDELKRALATAPQGNWTAHIPANQERYNPMVMNGKQAIAHLYGLGTNEQNAASARAIALLHEMAPAFIAAVEALDRLTEWGRDNTSPTDSNSPHALLIAAQAALRAFEPATPTPPATRQRFAIKNLYTEGFWTMPDGTRREFMSAEDAEAYAEQVRREWKETHHSEIDADESKVVPV